LESVLSGPFCLASVKACAPSWLSCACETAPTYWVRPVEDVVVAQAARAPTMANARTPCFMVHPSGRAGSLATAGLNFRQIEGRLPRWRMPVNATRAPARPSPATARETSPCAFRSPGSPPRPRRLACRSDIEVRRLQGVVLDERPAWFDHVAHQRAENLIGGHGVLDADLQQPARLRVHGGFPQLFRIHLAQALEALDLAAFLRLVQQPGLRFG